MSSNQNSSYLLYAEDNTTQIGIIFSHYTQGSQMNQSGWLMECQCHWFNCLVAGRFWGPSGQGETGYMTSSLVQWGGFVAPAIFLSWERYAMICRSLDVLECFGKIWWWHWQQKQMHDSSYSMIFLSSWCIWYIWYILFVNWFFSFVLQSSQFQAFKSKHPIFFQRSRSPTPATPASLRGSRTWDHHLRQSQRSSGHRNTWRHRGMRMTSSRWWLGDERKSWNHNIAFFFGGRREVLEYYRGLKQFFPFVTWSYISRKDIYLVLK